MLRSIFDVEMDEAVEIFIELIDFLHILDSYFWLNRASFVELLGFGLERTVVERIQQIRV